jgi:4-hydroxymandelate oxidase
MAVESRVATEGPLLAVRDYERRARELMPRGVWNALFGDYGAEDWIANTHNIDGFESFALRPRVMVDVSRRDLATTLLGSEVSIPVAITPSGHQQRWHPEGELATTRAAGAAGALMCLSTSSSFSIEEVAEVATGPLWYQLYWLRERRLTEMLVRRAEDAGYRAIVITVDAPATRSRERDERHQWDLGVESDLGVTLEKDRMLRNFFGQEHLGVPLPDQADFNANFDDSLTWRDLEWLRGLTPLPIVIKGVQTGEDARLCVEHGVDGVTVSNHGAFALEAARATVETLPEVVAAVDGRAEVYLDGGVRKGIDVLKCLALGARAVFVGRAQLCGLSVAGEEGVASVIEIFRNELTRAMAFCGVTGVRDVPRELVTRIAGPAAAPDVVGSLERLARLREQGRLSEQEFAAAKAVVLRATS